MNLKLISSDQWNAVTPDACNFLMDYRNHVFQRGNWIEIFNMIKKITSRVSAKLKLMCDYFLLH